MYIYRYILYIYTHMNRGEMDDLVLILIRYYNIIMYMP